MRGYRSAGRASTHTERWFILENLWQAEYKKIMSKDVKQRIEELQEEIRKHDYLYYVKNQPEISDQQYDKLFRQLQKLEKEHPDLVTEDSPTQRVSEQPLEEFEQVDHSVPMLSVDNTYNEDELREFDKRVRKNLKTKNYEFVVEPKLDGLAINLRYEGSRLVTGATRGNGDRGDDVTANIKTIKVIPLKLRGKDVPEVFEARGEVYMPTQSFINLNKAKEKRGEQTFANPRNAAAGSLKLLDSRITAERNLAFYSYGCGEVSEGIADNHFDMLKKIKDFGIPVNPNFQKAEDIEKVIDMCKDWEDKKDGLDYQIDGMVIKVNSFEQHEKLGATGRAPRWCIAYKFPAEKAETKVQSVDVQVGKSGILTPVANLTPVQLAGTTVKRASLHNFDEVDRLGVRVGDTVIIEKAGEIIPHVIKVKKEARGKDTKPIERPKECPNCGGEVKKDKDGVYIRCKNPKCGAIAKEKLKYFVGKGQMNIDNLGDKIIDQFVEKGLVTTPADLYKLKVSELVELEKMGEKLAQKIIDNIESSKKCSLWRFINALGINLVGGQYAHIVADHFKSLDKLREASKEEIESIDQIGPKMAENIYEYFRDEKNNEIIDQMLKEGVLPKYEKGKTSEALKGKTVVVTGSLKNFKRSEIKEAITKAGGKASSSVSGNTDYLLVGENPGSKLNQAKEHGVEVIDEEKFMELLGK